MADLKLPQLLPITEHKYDQLSRMEIKSTFEDPLKNSHKLLLETLNKIIDSSDVIESQDGVNDVNDIYVLIEEESKHLIDASNELKTVENAFETTKAEMLRISEVPRNSELSFTYLEELYENEMKSKRATAKDFGELFEINLAKEKKENSYRSQSEKDKYGKNPKFRELKEMYWTMTHPDEELPPIGTWFENANGNDGSDNNDSESSDEELVVGGRIDLNCPLTMKLLEDPVTSTQCPHSFSYKPVMEYLKHGPQQCPVSGCQKMLRKDQLRRNPDLMRRVNFYVKREARRIAEEDARIERL